MTTESALIANWRQYLAQEEGGLHLADPGHPLGMFVGKTDGGSPRMVIRVDQRPAKPNISGLVLIERYEDSPGKWTLSFTLQDAQFLEVFLRLTADVHARSANAEDTSAALEIVERVFAEWRRLLKPRSLGMLTMEELRGLVGELWLIVEHFNITRPIAECLHGWLGPLGLPQDFWFSETGYHEAKSIGPATTSIKISSENQLDADDLSLLVLRVANTNDKTAGAVNLPGLVATLSAALTSKGESIDGLTDRLQRLGVDLDEPFYQDTWFVVAQVDEYAVTEQFPSIRASRIPGGVSHVLYQIDLAAIESFKRSSKKVS